jgi:hypothetical protein
MGDDGAAGNQRGAWKGSNVSEFQILMLRRARKFPRDLNFRVPGEELAPTPRPGERVVFRAHFERGFGLPVSKFFRDLLDFYGLQPHHLGANAMMLLSAFVTLCEGYLGVRPTIALWSRLFQFRSFRVGTGVFNTDPKTKKQVEVKIMSECGAAVIYVRNAGSYPHPTPPQSIKDWQMGFFYVSNPKDDDREMLNLPEFSLPPPTQLHWSEKPGENDTDVDRQMTRIAELMKAGLKDADLVAAWLCRRVLPLQRRCHRMCDMTGRLDPTRISTFQIEIDEFLQRMHTITSLKLTSDFKFGLKAYNRSRPPPVVCCFLRSLSLVLALFLLLTRSLYLLAVCRLRADGGRSEPHPLLPRQEGVG